MSKATKHSKSIETHIGFILNHQLIAFTIRVLLIIKRNPKRILNYILLGVAAALKYFKSNKLNKSIMWWGVLYAANILLSFVDGR